MIFRIICILSISWETVYSKNDEFNAILAIEQTDFNSQSSHFVQENVEDSHKWIRNKRSPHDDQSVVIINPHNATIILNEDFRNTSIFEANWLERQNVRIENEATSDLKDSNRKKRQTNEESTSSLPDLRPTLTNNETDRYICKNRFQLLNG